MTNLEDNFVFPVEIRPTGTFDSISAKKLPDMTGSRLIRIFVLVLPISLALRAPLSAEDLPDMRPILLGSDPKSLVNLIDTKHVMQRGVQHGALYFYAVVAPNGVPIYSRVWGNTKEVEPLRDELRNKLVPARFIPAVYNHRHVYAGFYGTLAFSTTGGKPHLRIFANQELPELQKESDFIAPQPISIPGHIYDFTKVKNPFGSWATEDKPGVADIRLTIDAAGHLKDAHVDSVTPPEKQQYSNAALEVMRQYTFLPAYRNGKAVDSVTHLKFYFIPAFYRLQ